MEEWQKEIIIKSLFLYRSKNPEMEKRIGQIIREFQIHP
jgi:hypothetical protein